MRPLRIAFLTSSRYAYYPGDYLGRGLGGTQVMLVLLSTALAKRGHSVAVYNSCYRPGLYEGVNWHSLGDGMPEPSAEEGGRRPDARQPDSRRGPQGKILSPARRREAVRHVRSVCKEASERRVCKVLRQPRSTQRYRDVRRDEEKVITNRMLSLVGEHPRYGYRRIWASLRAEGFRVNRKRVYRLWRREGLKVPERQRKTRRLGTTANGCVRHRSEHMNHVWSYDSVMDQTIDSRPLKLLPIVDEFTRECLSIDVSRSIKASDVVESLRQLFEVRGAPKFIRSDNGPEFVAQAVRDWLAASGVDTLYIEPGSPWENAYSESFNSRFRDELLDRELFVDVRESRVVVEDYRLGYNHRRPHSSLGYQTPAAFAAEYRRPMGAPPPNPRLLSPPVGAIGAALEDQDLVSTLIETGT